MRLSVRILAVAMAVAVLSVTASLTVPNERAGAATAGKLYWIQLQEDDWLNFDFGSTRVARNNVDWAIDFLFYGNASINKVKSKLDRWFGFRGGPMYAAVNDGRGAVWDSDRGIKTMLCPVMDHSSAHMRIYAPPSTDKLWNRGWGYYVIASSHIDHNECWTGTWFGRSEAIEHWIAARARDAWGSSRVHEDYLSTSNFMMAATRNGYVAYAEGNHIWENNAQATVVRVP